MNLTLGFSPCPNDTFIFYAMTHGIIDTPNVYEVKMLDVEELNKKAFDEELDITKLSFNAYSYVSNGYHILESGSALGRGCGPLLIGNRSIDDEDVQKRPIYIPGKYTTANLLLSIAYPGAQNKVELLFSDIESKVQSHDEALGLIIHENRFTYADRGLVKIKDLGEYWESKTGAPIPLGCIAAKRSLSIDEKTQIDQDIYNSIAYAYNHEAEVLEYCRQFAQEMDMNVMKAHIDLYVNDFTLNLGSEGKEAIHRLYEEMMRINIGVLKNQDIFYKK